MGTERTIVENKDFRDIIPQYSCLSTNKKIKQNHPLFYVDSPYLCTTGYKSDFKAGDMRDLIKALADSRDKFIFSCRACKSLRSKKEETVRM
jgi:site-specific DNA-adenine methylase